MGTSKERLRERYEIYGDENDYLAAVPLYQAALANAPDDPRLLTSYGYLQDCHGRRAIRAAAGCYERAIAADPGYDKPHWQLIAALAALGEAGRAVPRYRSWVTERPDDARGYRFLACALLHARDYDQAADVIAAGLAVVPGDTSLMEQQGDLHAATGNPDDALGCWQRAFDLAPDDYGISMRYSAADLLERLGRRGEAASEWKFIADWCTSRGYAMEAEWPAREYQRLTS
jgi:tetratricopeptide (TPR) repeat protein